MSKETYLYIPVRQMGVQNSQSRRADARTERAREITLWRCLPWVFMCLYVSLGAWCVHSVCPPSTDQDGSGVQLSNMCVHVYSVKSDKMCEVEVAVRRQSSSRHYRYTINRLASRTYRLPLRWPLRVVGNLA